MTDQLAALRAEVAWLRDEARRSTTVLYLIPEDQLTPHQTMMRVRQSLPPECCAWFDWTARMAGFDDLRTWDEKTRDRLLASEERLANAAHRLTEASR